MQAKAHENPTGRGEIIIVPQYKLGHIIGFKDGKILCEELDCDHNFIVNNGIRKVFACSPEKAKQIGYLDLISESFKKQII
jgi:hypothetical protein